eukprot:3008601-Prymnesium_polylepis.1
MPLDRLELTRRTRIHQLRKHASERVASSRHSTCSTRRRRRPRQPRRLCCRTKLKSCSERRG